MIINTGCRTDIPAFYSKWLMNRIREGYVLVRNPYNPSQVTKYSLSPNVADCLAFCTKNPEPMLKYLDELDGRLQVLNELRKRIIELSKAIIGDTLYKEDFLRKRY